VSDTGSDSEAADSGHVDGAARDADPGNAPPPDPTTASSFLINTMHTGAVTGSGMTPPLKKIWSVTLGPNSNYEYISFPLIVHGVVYVLVESLQGTSSLLALDAHTGKTLWGPVDAQRGFGHAYDAGRVFVVNSAGVLQAFDASSGTPMWSATLPHPYPDFSAAPTAYRGIVYVGGGGDIGGWLYATDEATGALLWKQSVYFGDDSVPTVSDDGVFVSYACNQADGFDRISGSQLWHHTSGCSGGGGETTVLFDGLLYARDGGGNLKLKAATGAEQGSFSATRPPAFDGHMGFFVDKDLRAVDLDTSATEWTFAGDGYLDTPAVVAANTVYVGSLSGMLYALDETTGQLLWSDNAGGLVTYAEVPIGLPFVAMAAAEGILVTPAGSALVAYRPAAPGDAATDTE
jgi:outer membrane protein assembly factor BamB